MKVNRKIIIVMMASLMLSWGESYAKTGKEIISSCGLKPSVEPLLTTHWSQKYGENDMLPVVSEDGKKAVTGCGATAMAQVMNYWKYPVCGRGENWYVWDNVLGGKKVRHADFANSPIDWDNMASKYRDNKNVTQVQIDAVAGLMYQIGVALEMKYLTSSTATQIEYIHTVLKKVYGYNENMCLLRYCNGAYSADEWREIIYKELDSGRPVLMGGTKNSVNHIFVADGYDEEGNVHLNLGHGSLSEDTYYDLTQTGVTYTEDLRMIIGISSETLPAETKDVVVTTPGSLLNVLGGETESQKICRLKVTGNLNAEDIAVLAKMTRTTTGQLSYLDLSAATIEGNILASKAFNDNTDNNYTLQEIVLPENLETIGDNCFRNCLGLWKVVIPSSLKNIGNYAFSNCRYLEKINLPKSLSSIGTNPFRYDKLDCLEIADGNPYFKIVDNALLNASGKTLYFMALKTGKEYIVPEGVESIRPQAFVKCCWLEEVTIPESVKTFGSNSFLEGHDIASFSYYSIEPPTLQDAYIDAYTRSNCTLHVPNGYAEVYRSRGWGSFASIVDDLQLASNIDKIGVSDSFKSGVKTCDIGGRGVNGLSKGILVTKKGNTTRKIMF